MAKRNSPYNGLLIVDKPGRACALGDGTTSPNADKIIAAPPAKVPIKNAGQDFPTSHDVVQRVRRWSRQRRIGHTGTLDPMASGVLVLCLGHATRLVEYYQNHPKHYYAEITLGRATDTYDAFGEETACAPIPTLSPGIINAALEPFRGDILQTPPLYSAIKQGGESLHRKARRGEEVIVTPRPVTFYEIDLLHYDASVANIEAAEEDAEEDAEEVAEEVAEEDAEEVAEEVAAVIALRVRCSAGGYIRSLAHDLGEALGTVAHLSGLRREAAGPFTLDDAHSMQAIEAASEAGQLEQLLLPLGERLDMPRLVLDAESVVRLGQGQRVVLRGAAVERAKDAATDDLVQGLDGEGTFVGIARHLGPASMTDPQPEPTAQSGIEPSDKHVQISTQEARTIWKAEKWFVT